MYESSAEPAPLPRDRSPAAVEADNLIRRRLRIGDPNDATEVAEGLRRLFRSDAEALKREASGLPIVAAPPARPMVPADGPSSAELEQARDDVERDLKALITNSQLKDIEPELSGWGQAIRGIVADGIASAGVALDPRARDRAMAARRQLGDYARLARFVGALTCNHNQAYRRLAQSLDQVAALILVLIGESLARIGFGGGRFLLQAPASELQARRDAVIAALRNLNGVTQEAYGSGDWPWGLRGLRQVLDILDESGHADLRALFDENTVARLMDDLLDRAATVNARGLRALGATAAVTVQRFNRLVQIVGDRVQPGSPPLVAYLEAIRLFVDGFTGAGGGYRLLFIARPPVVFYGLYGIGGPDTPTRRLQALVTARGRLAELLDCYLGGECCEDPAICQVLLDKLLYDTDRAIDLYALSGNAHGNGEPEWRAAAYGLLIRRFREEEKEKVKGCLKDLCLSTLSGDAGLDYTLKEIEEEILGVEIDSLSARKAMRDELCLQRSMDDGWRNLLATMAPSCVLAGTAIDRIETLIDAAIQQIFPRVPPECPRVEPEFAPTPVQSLKIFNDIPRHPWIEPVFRAPPPEQPED